MHHVAKTLNKHRAGRPFRAVRDEMLGLIGPTYTPTEQTISNYHSEKHAPKHLDVVIVAALCEIYGIQGSDLDATLQQAMKAASDLLIRRSTWMAA